MTFLTAPSCAPIASPTSDNDAQVIDEADLSQPSWIFEQRDSWGEHFTLPEWEDEIEGDEHGGYRAKHGWKGRDYLHCSSAPVRVVDYFVQYGDGKGVAGAERGGVGTILTGVVHFTERAESHQGLCHGGSMCSVMDDIIGWCAMFVTGKCHPWSGYTVQVNTSLRRPIPVKSYLLAQATIVKIERRKVSIEVVLLNPTDNSNTIHAEGNGLVVMNKGVLPC